MYLLMKLMNIFLESLLGMMLASGLGKVVTFNGYERRDRRVLMRLDPS